MWRRRCFHGINVMILMPQIFDVTANENARYKRNELKCTTGTLAMPYPLRGSCPLTCITVRTPTYDLRFTQGECSNHCTRAPLVCFYAYIWIYITLLGSSHIYSSVHIVPDFKNWKFLFKYHWKTLNFHKIFKYPRTISFCGFKDCFWACSLKQDIY